MAGEGTKAGWQVLTPGLGTAFLGSGDDQRRYFGEARVVVLTTFSNPTKMRNVMKLLLELSGGRGRNFMLYRSWPAFDDRFRPPVSCLELFTDPWERAGPHAPFYINGHLTEGVHALDESDADRRFSMADLIPDQPAADQYT